jgi:hypothetical protein
MNERSISTQRDGWFLAVFGQHSSICNNTSHSYRAAPFRGCIQNIDLIRSCAPNRRRPPQNRSSPADAHIALDPVRTTLSQSNPDEGWIAVGEQVRAARMLAIPDAPRDALGVAGHEVVFAHARPLTVPFLSRLQKEFPRYRGRRHHRGPRHRGERSPLVAMAMA